MADSLALSLVCESKICTLLDDHDARARWEASGVLIKDGYCFVVFDDRPEIGRVSLELKPNEGNALLGLSHPDGGYEGIAFNHTKQRYYLLVEARKHKGEFRAFVVEYDVNFAFVRQRPLDFTFESCNKGFEAIAHVRRGGQDYLLALCEGNQCKSGAKGRTPGNGRIQVFEKNKKRWAHVGTIALPATLPFVDYSGMSVDEGRTAVVSQVNSMLWIGQLNESDWSWRDAGTLYEFPRSSNEAISYGNIEGVAWLSATRIVAVSDRRKKKEQPDNCIAEKDQSLHIFDIPNSATGPLAAGRSRDE